eukprot:137224-Pelagomonas_calceolata.AAC.5
MSDPNKGMKQGKPAITGNNKGLGQNTHRLKQTLEAKACIYGHRVIAFVRRLSYGLPTAFLELNVVMSSGVLLHGAESVLFVSMTQSRKEIHDRILERRKEKSQLRCSSTLSIPEGISAFGPGAVWYKIGVDIPELGKPSCKCASMKDLAMLDRCKCLDAQIRKNALHMLPCLFLCLTCQIYKRTLRNTSSSSTLDPRVSRVANSLSILRRSNMYLERAASRRLRCRSSAMRAPAAVHFAQRT